MPLIPSQTAKVIQGDCVDEMLRMDENSVDAIVTDPPYGLEFMGKEWDRLQLAGDSSPTVSNQLDLFGGPAIRRGDGQKAQEWHRQWTHAALRVLKYGGYMLAFGGTRTYPRLACAAEDVGFEVCDTICWLHSQGFPKGDSCLKPAFEPILVCCKPGRSVLPLGIDECRIGTTVETWPKSRSYAPGQIQPGGKGSTQLTGSVPPGRWPANVVHDGSEEVMKAFAAFGEKGDFMPAGTQSGKRRQVNTYGAHSESKFVAYGDTGTAARFFYCAKASRRERGEGNNHPTVKPLALMKWLVKLVAPLGSTVLDPFSGSGTTLVAALRAGRKAIGIEREPEYCEIARARIKRPAPVRTQE